MRSVIINNKVYSITPNIYDKLINARYESEHINYDIKSVGVSKLDHILKHIEDTCHEISDTEYVFKSSESESRNYERLIV